MKRGDIYRVDFEPSVAGEPARSRLAVVLTNNDANAFLPHVVVAPVTSNVSRNYPFNVMLAAGTCGLSETSRIQLNDLDQRLKVHLGLA